MGPSAQRRSKAIKILQRNVETPRAQGCMCVYIYTFMCMLFMHRDVNVYMCLCVYIRVYIYICVCVYIYMCIYLSCRGIFGKMGPSYG